MGTQESMAQHWWEKLNNGTSGLIQGRRQPYSDLYVFDDGSALLYDAQEDEWLFVDPEQAKELAKQGTVVAKEI